MRSFFALIIIVILGGCGPKEQIVFRKVLNIRLEAASKTPVLKADVVLFNPNEDGGKLKKAELEIFVNDKKVGFVDQILNQKIKGQTEFSVPIEVNLAMKELGLMDTLISLLGGKKYDLHITGKIRVSVRGFAFNVPVDQREEIKLKL